VLEARWTDPGAALRSSLRNGMDTWFTHRAVIHAVLENQHAVPALAQVWSAASAPFVAVLTDQIRREREAGRAIAGLPAEAIATMLVAGAERIFYVGSTGTDAKASVTSLLSALPRADLTSLFSHLPVAVPNLASVLANPTGIVGALPLADLQWLLSNLPVAAPSGLAGVLANPTGLLGSLLPTLTGLLSNPTALLTNPTSLLSQLPTGDLAALLAGLPVAVPNLSAILANPSSLVSSLPLTDLRFLLNSLPVQVPGNLLP